MSKARYSGDEFEFLFLSYLMSNGVACNETSVETFENLQSKFNPFDGHKFTTLNELFKEFDKHFIAKYGKIYRFSLCNDNTKHSSDVTLHGNANEEVAVSLKRNNKSLKAQRPGSLPLHLGENEDKAKIYQKNLNSQILDPFYESMKHCNFFRDL